MSDINNSRQFEELLKTDFSSASSSKEDILNRMLLKIENQEYNDDKYNFIKKRSFVKPIFIASIITVLLIGFAVTSYSQDLYKGIKEIFIGKYAKYIETETQKSTPDLTIPDELKGKLYDKDGSILKYFPEDGKIYNQTGEIVILSVLTSQNENKSFEVLTAKEYNDRQNSKMTSMTSLEEAKSYLAFDFSLPGYIPQGYAFDRIQLMNDDNGKPIKNCKYAYVYFSNNYNTKEIYLQLRLMAKETDYEASIGNIEEIEINGNKGIIGKGYIHIEINDVMYMLMACDSGIDNEQLIKMAESIHP